MSALTRTCLIGAVVAVGLSAGCGTTTPVHARTTTLTWAAVSANLSPTLNPASSNPCQRGDLSCLDILKNEMVRRARLLVGACNHDAMFAVLYEETTAAIRAAARAGRFRNPALMSLFTVFFARLYTRAFDAWRAGRHDAVPAAWQVAFRAADQREVSGLGDLLLGMNAHITHDLPYAVAAVMQHQGSSVNRDYALVNQIIIAINQPSLRDIANHLDPNLSLAEIPIALGAQPSVGALIAQWRTESWRNGIALRDATAGNRSAVEARIEDAADLRATLIESATAYLPLIENSTQRDAYCSAHHGAAWPS